MSEVSIFKIRRSAPPTPTSKKEEETAAHPIIRRRVLCAGKLSYYWGSHSLRRRNRSFISRIDAGPDNYASIGVKTIVNWTMKFHQNCKLALSKQQRQKRTYFDAFKKFHLYSFYYYDYFACTQARTRSREPKRGSYEDVGYYYRSTVFAR